VDKEHKAQGTRAKEQGLCATNKKRIKKQAFNSLNCTFNLVP